MPCPEEDHRRWPDGVCMSCGRGKEDALNTCRNCTRQYRVLGETELDEDPLCGKCQEVCANCGTNDLTYMKKLDGYFCDACDDMVEAVRP